MPSPKKKKSRTTAKTSNSREKTNVENQNNKFTYSYSAKENKEVRDIRNKYLPKEENKLDELKHLDRQVGSAGTLEALVSGILGALIFGVGLCSGLGVIGGGLILAVILGLFGSIGIALAYPIRKAVKEKTKNRLVPQIIKLADEISGEKTDFNIS